MNCYPHADFAGLYGCKDHQDPHCAGSCTGYVIWVLGCWVLCYSCLQTEIAISAMETEHVALSAACKDLFSFVSLIHKQGAAGGFDDTCVFNIHCKVH